MSILFWWKLFIEFLFRRYFEGESKQDRASSTDHTPSADHASYAALMSAQGLVRERKLGEAVTVLEQALEQHSTDKTLWICYLRLKAEMVSVAQLPEFYQLLSKAITTSQSYSVILEVRVLSIPSIRYRQCALW